MDKYQRILDIIADVCSEVEKSEVYYPGFPLDAVHAAGMVTEAAGALMKASFLWAYDGHDPQEIRQEAINTGAMAIRLLIHIHELKARMSETGIRDIN